MSPRRFDHPFNGNGPHKGGRQPNHFEVSGLTEEEAPAKTPSTKSTSPPGRPLRTVLVSDALVLRANVPARARLVLAAIQRNRRHEAPLT